jgi:hypothetical protein
MKYLILVLLFAFIFSQSVVKTPLYCQRTFTQAFSQTQKTSTLTGTSNCQGARGTRASKVNFVVSNFLVPDIRVSFISKLQSDKGSAGKAFTKVVLYDSIIEYQETNNIPGYQPQNGTTQGDLVIRTQSLINLLRPGRVWGDVTYETSKVDNVVLHNQYMVLQKTGSDITDMKIGLTVAEAEIEVSINGSTTTKMILVPGGIKYTIDLNSITYQNTNSTGIALGGHIVTAGAIKFQNSTGSNKPNASIRPFESNDEQTTEFTEDTNDGGSGGYHSWRTSFRVRLQNQLQDHNIKVYGPQLVDCPVNNLDSLTCKRVYFSTTSRVDLVNWDPSLGAVESQTSSGNVNSILFTIILFFIFSIL